MKFRYLRNKLMAGGLAVLLAASAVGCSASGSGEESAEASASSTESADESDSSAESESNDTDTSNESTSDEASSSDEEINTSIVGDYSDKEISADWSDSEADSTFIALSSTTGSGTEASGKNASAVDITEDNGQTTITISKKGTYVFSGSIDECQILVNVSEDDNVQLVLNGAEISDSQGAPIVVESAKNCYLTVAEGTVNTISDTRSAKSDDSDDSEDDYSAAIFSKCDLIINGIGTLTVNGEYNDGITSKDDLKYISGTLTINASDDGLYGKDSVSIRDGSITISCDDDCIKSKNSDTDKGFVVIDDGDLALTSKSGHGINAINAAVINNGNVDITASYEGMQSRYIVINDGTVDITSSDDGINISADTTSSAQTSESEDKDTFSEDKNTFPEDKDFKTPDSANTDENTESGSDSPAPVSSDNNSRSHGFGGGHGGFGGGPGGGGMMEGDGIDGSLTINGGTVTVDAGGDGLDSNGSIYINGGYTIVSGSVDGGNGALDYATECVMTDGVLILSGNSSMASSVNSSDDSTVTMMAAKSSSNIAEGSEIELTDESGNVLYSWTVAKKCNYLQLAAPEINSSDTYYFVINGEEEEKLEASEDTASGMMGGGGFQK